MVINWKRDRRIQLSTATSLAATHAFTTLKGYARVGTVPFPTRGTGRARRTKALGTEENGRAKQCAPTTAHDLRVLISRKLLVVA